MPQACSIVFALILLIAGTVGCSKKDEQPTGSSAPAGEPSAAPAAADPATASATDPAAETAQEIPA